LQEFKYMVVISGWGGGGMRCESTNLWHWHSFEVICLATS